jgi:mono/diheme cytochrome c family protein
MEDRFMTRSSKTAWIFAVLLGGPVAHVPADDALWSAPAAAAQRHNPIPSNAASIEQGRGLFKQYCVSCHGPAGRGDGPAAASLKPRPADLAMMAGHHLDGDLAWKIANGRGAMPPWKGSLSDNQIWTLVNFIKSLPATDSRHGNMEHHRH